MLQPQRLTADPETYEKVDSFIRRGREFTTGKVLPFTVILDDPAGNSWVDRVPEDGLDRWQQTEYQRTPEQNAALGLSNPDAGQPIQQSQEEKEEEVIGPDDVHTFWGPCPSCTRPCATHMMPVDIPHFKEVIIMSTVCEFCGYKSNEVKTGGEISPMGRKITLKVEDSDDLTRDILKVPSPVIWAQLTFRARRVHYTFRNFISIYNREHWVDDLPHWRASFNKPTNNFGGEFIIPIPIPQLPKRRNDSPNSWRK